ncbi:hypothetical protein ACJ72_02770 [Emergomyces africanus]|uniref:Uncharacterized protein n=1 Tax=Emergomyces africanus TaxID=1955775 RepID=A0A1B7P1G3_9EURO|nr:hypothetical protein ACJ72_02770 [Emergomyces africanus]
MHITDQPRFAKVETYTWALKKAFRRVNHDKSIDPLDWVLLNGEEPRPTGSDSDPTRDTMDLTQLLVKHGLIARRRSPLRIVPIFFNHARSKLKVNHRCDLENNMRIPDNQGMECAVEQFPT